MIRFLNRPDYVFGGKHLSLYGDRGSGLEMVEAPELPYGFVGYDVVMTELERDFERTELREPFTGSQVYRYTAVNPRDVGRYAEELARQRFRSYETDIPYIRRLLIDREISIDYRDITFIDVELDDSKGWQKPGQMPFLSLAWRVGNGSVEWRTGDVVSAVRELVEAMVQKKSYLIVGWNVGFDREHLRALMMRASSKRNGGVSVWSHLRECEWIDLMSLYKFYVRGLGSYSLDSVARHEGLGEKVRTKKVSELSEDELRDYNMRDVELLTKIEEKYRFAERTKRMAIELNLSVKDILAGETIVWDCLILRRLRELGYVAPRKVYGRKQGYEGAHVFEPVYGLHQNVALFDFVSLYPSIVIRDKIDVFSFTGEVVPYLLTMFLQKKLEAEATGDKLGREMYKILLNSCYGQFGYVGSRYFDENKAAAVTAAGREALLKLRDFLEKLGLKVYYGDTDSVFVSADGMGDMKALEMLINEQFRPLQVKFDKLFSAILFMGREGRGVKKRYAGLTVDGKLVVKGLEIVRGDWSKFTKKILLNTLYAVLGGDMDRVRDVVSQAYDALVQRAVPKEDLVITRKLRDELEQYKTKPFWVKLWEQYVQSGRIPETVREISYVMYVDGPDLPDVDKPIDYRWYWEKQLLPPLERILESCRMGGFLRSLAMRVENKRTKPLIEFFGGENDA